VLGVIFKYWYDYKGMVAKLLWEKRYETYKKLLEVTGKLPLYPARADLVYGDVLHAAEEMRDWYFKEGGLLLSKKARDKYFAAQKKIVQVMKKQKKENVLDPVGDDYETIRSCFSELRTELTNDLMSRKRMQEFFESKNIEPKEEVETITK
jgi:hypothetical protein